MELKSNVENLLEGEKKWRVLGDLSPLDSERLVEIKSSVERGEIQYEDLREELKKHLDLEEIKPGTISQVLVSCVSDETETSCPIKKERVEDVPYIYDSKSDSLIKLSKFDQPF